MPLALFVHLPPPTPRTNEDYGSSDLEGSSSVDYHYAAQNQRILILFIDDATVFNIDNNELIQLMIIEFISFFSTFPSPFAP